MAYRKNDQFIKLYVILKLLIGKVYYLLIIL